MKGIILAGGHGTRLHPLTLSVSKQLLPVYDKPMIYYPMSTLMLAGIRDILVITTPRDQEHFRRVLGTGEHFGINLSYAVQEHPDGIAKALVVGAGFVGRDNVALALGDNILFGQGLQEVLKDAANLKEGAHIFGYHVPNPGRYGVVEFDTAGRPVGIVEKPERPRSNWAVVGLYFYDNSVLQVASGLKPSARGEFEITDVNAHFLRHGQLAVRKFSRGVAWLDTGTHESLLQAGEYVRTIQQRTGLFIACLEEIALVKGWLTREDVSRRAASLGNSDYGAYLLRVLEEREHP